MFTFLSIFSIALPLLLYNKFYKSIVGSLYSIAINKDSIFIRVNSLLLWGVTYRPVDVLANLCAYDNTYYILSSVIFS